jgi:hypothetical protein
VCVPQYLALVLSPSKSASVNSRAIAELVLGVVVDLLITRGQICTCCAVGALWSWSWGLELELRLRLRPGHLSSSDVSGFVLHIDGTLGST